MFIIRGKNSSTARLSHARDRHVLGRLRAKNAALAAALHTSESRFSLFIDKLPDACMLLDSDFRFVYFNRAAAKASGIALEDGIGKPIRLAEPGGDPGGRLELYRRVLQSGEPMITETVVPCGEQGLRRFRVHVFGAAEGLGLIWTDITESKRKEDSLSATQAELSALALHLIDVREEERKSFAREMHDELGQALTAIEMELRMMAREPGPASEETKERIGRLLSMANRSIRAVQRMSSELRPAVLDSLGLSAAIEWLAEDFSSRGAPIARADVDIREDSLGPKASTALFRITQEALTNIARHARASKADISLRVAGPAIELSISDDGVGISEAQASSPTSFGIQGITERARGLGGSVSISGRRGEGTSLIVTIPLPEQGRLP
jgi:PAS domain S-box-containing protein